jgi:hypothetical protein
MKLYGLESREANRKGAILEKEVKNMLLARTLEA